MYGSNLLRRSPLPRLARTLPVSTRDLQLITAGVMIAKPSAIITLMLFAASYVVSGALLFAVAFTLLVLALAQA